MRAAVLVILAAVGVVGVLAGTASATVTIATVPVGDAGNPGELSGAGAGGYGADRICGSVEYAYNIGQYEVTASQYCSFLNAKAKTDTYGLYNASMWNDTSNGCMIQQSGTSGNYTYSVATGYGNRPVNYVSYWDSCRFANWLHNGQDNGDTESGAYTLNGYNGDDGRTIQRNTNWQWAVTSEDEWYKSAFYNPSTGGYYDYPTSSNHLNIGTANYVYSYVGHTTDVGDYGNASPYGTFDQGGNVWEWHEAVMLGSWRGLRGGSFYTYENILRASNRDDYGNPSYESLGIGFRVVQVPEPATLMLLALGGLAITRRRLGQQ